MGAIYTNMKIFHYKDKIDSLPRHIKEITPPIHVRIKPTNTCNHRCTYCAYLETDLQLGQDMVEQDFIPKDKMMEIIDDMIEMGVKAVTFSGGGEPFCYPYLVPAVEKLSRSAIKFAALTNGSRLSGEVAELFASQATWLRISMDGWDDESYQKYRNVKSGEFTKIIKNIRQFKKYDGQCLLGVSIIVGRENAGHIYDLISILTESRVDTIKIAPCIVSNNRIENNRYHDPIFKNVKEEIELAKQDFGKNVDIFDSYHTQLDSFDKQYKWCPYMQILHVIGADQNIYPCQDKAYNLETGLLGSIKNRRYKDFWLEGKDKFFRINPSAQCNHHCVANTKNEMIFNYLNANEGHLAFV